MKQQHLGYVQLILCLTVGFSLDLLFAHLTSHAASPITPSGLNTQVTLSATPPAGKTQYDITGGTRPGGGVNLFHSFGDFNVPNNNIANFLNDSGLATSNILGRVTGGNISNIFGAIQTQGFGSANLFLMNPAGFLFGPNATVNVGGMVTFTSADYLRLADNAKFNAVPGPADALLTAAPVAAFGFLGSNPGAITVQGSQLSVTPGQSISLVGGNITIQSGVLDDGVTTQPARLAAPGGQINLASVASPGEILAGTLEPAPNLNGQSFGALGTTQIIEKGVLDTSGYDGGTILIRGGRFIVDDSTISANVTGPAPKQRPGQTGTGIDIQMTEDVLIQNLAVLETNVTDQASPGIGSGGVRIRADHIEIVGVPDLELFPFTGIRSNVALMSAGGSSGDITLEANSILMKDLSFLQTLTESIGNSGAISLRTIQNIESENFVGISTGSQGPSGNAGNIELSSAQGDILLNSPFMTSQANGLTEDGSPASVLSSANSGNITLNAPNGNILLSQAGAVFNSAEGTTGSLGKIEITAKNLTLREGSLIEGDNLTQQLPDNITVTLFERLTLESNSLIATSAWRSAPAANLTVTAPQILITEGSFLTTETFRSGEGGRLTLVTDSLQLTSGGQLRSGSRPTPFAPPDVPLPIPTGAGGTVVVQGPAGPAQSILIDGVGSGILTDTQGTGRGGDIFVNANSITLQDGGILSAATTGIATSANGGTITVNAEHVAVNSQAVITADTNGIAPAGTVDINTGSLAINSGGQIRSSSSAEQSLIRALTAAPPLTGGTITVQGRTGAGSLADSVTIDGAGSGIFTQSTGNRPGGDINILASGSVTMTNGATISASSAGAGNAGNIQINAGNQFAMTNSTVTTEANQASGGAIKITTSPSGTVQLTDSTISASVLDGTGGGGSVNIDPEFVILQNSQILANAVFGPGGNINITTNLLLPDTTSVISASSQFGQQGTISIQSPISPASGKIVPLSQKPLIATTLVSQRCAALAHGDLSSFTIAGRDSLPAEPGGWVSSPLALANAELVGGTVPEPNTRADLSGPAGETPILSLRRIAPPGFLTQSFAADSPGGCT